MEKQIKENRVPVLELHWKDVEGNFNTTFYRLPLEFSDFSSIRFTSLGAFEEPKF